MPNYYIQARRSTFNPFSFDEYVKPLNMYKEYYEKNEEALTDMQAQANLWQNIMESETDSKLADKYKTYVNNLNNATQQLKNGMSYNLRNQIQQLRGQSAMVKQIENAYNLRAKDIDAYNELMIKDPSRIGADDPTSRGLDMYLNGPVKNNYGVSGDRLYALGNARAKAMSAQRDKYGNAVEALGKQYFMLKHSTGFSDKEITELLKNKNSELFNEIDRIIQQEGTPLNNANDLNTAETYILNGMLSGFTYDEDRKYMKNENFLTDYQKAQLAHQQYVDETNRIKALNQLNKTQLSDLNNYHAQLSGSLNYSVKNLVKDTKLDDPIPFLNEDGNIDSPSYNLNDDIFSGEIGKSKIIIDDKNNLYTENLQKIEDLYNERLNEYKNANSNDSNIQSLQNLSLKNGLSNDELVNYYNELDRYIDYLNEYQKDKLDGINVKDLKREARELIQINKFLQDVPGETMSDKYNNYVGYYNIIDSQQIHGWKYYDSAQNLGAIDKVMKELLKTATISEYDNKTGKVGDADDKLKSQLLKDGKDIDVYPSAIGLMAVTNDNKNNKKLYVINTDDADINVYNNNINAIRELLNVDYAKKKYELSDKTNDGFAKLSNNYWFKIENGNYVFVNTNDEELHEYKIPLYDAYGLLSLINDMVGEQAKSIYDRAVPQKQEATDILNDILNQNLEIQNTD